ncbi:MULTISPECIES: type IV toxin-antitoxin system AbiEi family antitoxin [Modestobacter]|uniref:type IV toxin-antitoxin system AbiEi family antitoxin n=1 Tax=Modestobacter TaxID=88138 RepID=UPI001E656413|nr:MULTISPECIES: type IV toxin-antitoxin system AbiEi family antitoxin [Modestobacter]
MPRPTRRPERLRGRVFRGTAAVRSGLLTPDDLRSAAWVRLFPDVYADAALDLTHTVRAQAVGRLLLPHGVVSGGSAAVLWGLTDLARPEDDVEVTVAPGTPRGAAPGMAVRRRVLPGERVRPVEGVRATAPETTALELAGRSPSTTASSCWTGSWRRGPPRWRPCG